MKNKDKNKASSKGKKLTVNMAGVESRGHLEDGQYPGQVEACSVEDGDKAQYIKWEFVLVGSDEDKWRGRKVYYNTSLAAQALWNLRNLLETLGVEVPDDEMELDLKSYVGLKLMLRVQNETWEGKERPKVTDFTPMEEDEGGGDEAEEETEEAGEEEEAAEEEEETAEEEEAEGDDEGDGKISADEVRELDEAELKDLVKKHKLKVDLDKYPKAAKKIGAVIQALDEKDLLAE